MPTFVWNKCGGKLCLAIPGSEGHSSACAWNMGAFLWAYKQFQAALFSQNCTNSPFRAVAGIVANWFEGANWPLCMDALAPRL